VQFSVGLIEPLKLLMNEILDSLFLGLVEVYRDGL
jgi:hypothetical protein